MLQCLCACAVYVCSTKIEQTNQPFSFFHFYFKWSFCQLAMYVNWKRGCTTLQTYWECNYKHWQCCMLICYLKVAVDTFVNAPVNRKWTGHLPSRALQLTQLIPFLSLLWQIREDWKYVAMVIDRLQLCFFCGITTFGTFALLLDAPHIFQPIDQDQVIKINRHDYEPEAVWGSVTQWLIWKVVVGGDKESAVEGRRAAADSCRRSSHRGCQCEDMHTHLPCIFCTIVPVQYTHTHPVWLYIFKLYPLSSCTVLVFSCSLLTLVATDCWACPQSRPVKVAWPLLVIFVSFTFSLRRICLSLFSTLIRLAQASLYTLFLNTHTPSRSFPIKANLLTTFLSLL